MQRRLFVTSVCSSLTLPCPAFGKNDSPAQQIAIKLCSMERSGLGELMVSEDFSRVPALMVVFENTGRIPLRLMSFDNSFGYRNLFFEVRSGKEVEIIQKKPRSFRRNLPLGFVIQPKSAISLPVSFITTIWGEPKIGWNQIKELRARYEQNELERGDQPEGIDFRHQWSGKVSSEWLQL